MRQIISPLDGFRSPFGRLMGSTAPFTPAVLFGASEPGVWYDPSDVANLAWRRNLLTFTEQFDNAAWVKSGATVSANAAAAPNGTTTADKLVENTANTNHRATQDFTVTSGLDYTFTVYAKSVERSRIILLLVLAGSFRVQTFNLDSGTVQASASSGAALTNPVATIADAGNGWFRCSLKVTTASSGAMNTGFDINNSDASSSAYLGDGTSGILIWGAQLELGSVATDYQRISDVNTEVIERFPSATLYQDPAGTIPVTGPAQTVGLALDKSKGLVLGSEAVVNGGFATDTDWTKGSGWTISGGVASCDGSVQFSQLSQPNVTPLSKYFKVSFTLVSKGASVTNLRVVLGGAFVGQVDVTSAGTYSGVFFNSGGSLTFALQTQAGTGAAFAVSIDNISVKELPGNHATQATLASRPTYGIVPLGGRRNLLLNTDTLATQNVTVTAVSHVLSFTGTGTITLSGVSTAGPLVGTGVNDRVSLTFTPTAGTLTLTVSGSVKFAQLERA